jgi:hypothetical protein
VLFNFLYALAVLTVIAGIAFQVGRWYQQDRDQLTQHRIASELANLNRQRDQLTRWVRKNWPTEYEAWRRGSAEGYQQGVLQAAALEEEQP